MKEAIETADWRSDSREFYNEQTAVH